jgi:hypothetical protein
MQEILAVIDMHLQRLGGVDPDRKQSCSTRRGVSAVLLPYYHVLQERRHQARQRTLLSYFKNKSKKPSIDPQMAEDDPFDPDDPQPGIPPIINAYV